MADFEDGTFSNNFYPEDVEECNCGSCRGAHLSGARVKVSEEAKCTTLVQN